MSKHMGRPKVLAEDVVRLQVNVPWQADASLNAVAAASGVSKATLVRTFIETGLRAYVDVWTDLTATPPTPRPRSGNAS